MFPSPDRAHRGTTRRSAGFTLIEVIAALGILLIVMAALTPQVVASLRATGTARDITQAKGVAQGRLEQMRATPFYVGREAGDFIDILDTYYRNTTAPATAPACATQPLAALPPTTWTGYAGTASTHCPWEPAGPLYRTVINPIQAPGLGVFSMVVSTQFLTGSASPIAPPSGYDSQTAGSDQPPANQVGVTVAVFFRSHNGVKYTSTYTQIERSAPSDPLIQTDAGATTVQVSSAAQWWQDWVAGAPDPAEPASSNDQPTLLATIGVLNLSGELYAGSRVVSSATAAAGSTSQPATVTGASTNLVAPLDTAATGATVGSVWLPNGCRWVCFGATSTSGVSSVASNGQPRSGSPTAPATASIPATTTNYGFWFDNGRWRNRLNLLSGQPMVSLDTNSSATLPGVSQCVVGGTGSTSQPSALSATGFLDATAADDPNRLVRSCATAQTRPIRLFPTQFAPDGVLRITLDRSSAHCRTGSGTTPAAQADYLATIAYWNGSSYTTVSPIRDSNTNDPLERGEPGTGHRRR